MLIAYTSIYGNTKAAALRLEEMLKSKGASVKAIDLARYDISEATAQAFRYSKLVLASSTYNADVFPPMREFLAHLTERGYQKRTVALIENGSWAPMAAKVMRAAFEKSKDITFMGTVVTIRSAMNADTAAALEAMANELC